MMDPEVCIEKINVKVISFFVLGSLDEEMRK